MEKTQRLKFWPQAKHKLYAHHGNHMGRHDRADRLHSSGSGEVKLSPLEDRASPFMGLQAGFYGTAPWRAPFQVLDTPCHRSH